MLRRRVEEAGYSIEKLTYINSALFPLAVMSRLADRLRNASQSSGSAMPPAPVNAVMKAMFSAESLIVQNASLPFGVSLLAVFSKDEADLDGRLAA